MWGRGLRERRRPAKMLIIYKKLTKKCSKSHNFEHFISNCQFNVLLYAIFEWFRLTFCDFFHKNAPALTHILLIFVG